MSDSFGRIQRQPTNFSELRNTSFRLTIDSLDNVNFFTQAANLPGLQLGDITQMTPLGNVPWSGNHQFEELQVQFLVDEDLRNWLEIHNWIKLASTISDFENYDVDEIHREGTLIIKTNQFTPNLGIRFHNLTPRTLSGIDFDARASEPERVLATVTFAYTDYEIELL